MHTSVSTPRWCSILGDESHILLSNRWAALLPVHTNEISVYPAGFVAGTIPFMGHRRCV
jgi:hypothetical protein